MPLAWQGFSTLLGNSPSVDLMGIAVGHLYFFLDDVLPHTRGGYGCRPLRSAAWMRRAASHETTMAPQDDTQEPSLQQALEPGADADTPPPTLHAHDD